MYSLLFHLSSKLVKFHLSPKYKCRNLLLHLECHFSYLKIQSIIWFSTSPLQRSVIKRDQLDWNWRMWWNDTRNAIDCSSFFHICFFLKCVLTELSRITTAVWWSVVFCMSRFEYFSSAGLVLNMCACVCWFLFWRVFVFGGLFSFVGLFLNM